MWKLWGQTLFYHSPSNHEFDVLPVRCPCPSKFTSMVVNLFQKSILLLVMMWGLTCVGCQMSGWHIRETVRVLLVAFRTIWRTNRMCKLRRILVKVKSCFVFVFIISSQWPHPYSLFICLFYVYCCCVCVFSFLFFSFFFSFFFFKYTVKGDKTV